MGVIIYNGQSSEDFGLHVSYRPDYDLPVRDVEEITLPGRDGTILYDNGRYDKTERKYAMTFGNEDVDFYDMAIKMSKWLNSSPSKYVRLSDSYEPDVYRLARFVPDGPILPVLENAGGLEVKFECLPQRFYTEGDKPLVFKMEPTGSNKFNPDLYDSTEQAYEVYLNTPASIMPRRVFQLKPYLFVGDTPQAEIYYRSNNEKIVIPVTDDGIFIYSGASAYLKLEPTVYDPIISEVDIYRLILESFDVWNPTDYPSRPIIKIIPQVPAGIVHVPTYSLRINNIDITINLSDSQYIGPIIIDCEQRECYSPEMQNLNPYVSIYNGIYAADFPELSPGKNTVWFSDLQDGLKAEVIPKWWTM